MLRTPIGDTTLDVFPLCLGGNVFGWTADEQESFAVLDSYAESGGNFIDTADAYGSWVEDNPPGASELIIGRWLSSRGCRDEMIIATKVGLMPERRGLSPANIMRCAEESLARLQTDHIDVYYAHADDPEVPLEETLGAFDELIRRGWVRTIAASNYTAPRLREALATSKQHTLASYSVLQTHYNLVERDLFEGEMSELCEQTGVACLPYYSLASGFLTGKYREAANHSESVRAGTARSYLEDGRSGRAVLAVLDRLAGLHGASLAAIALAWLRQQKAVAAPIASARTPEQLADLVQMTHIKLDEEEMALLDKASRPSASA